MEELERKVRAHYNLSGSEEVKKEESESDLKLKPEKTQRRNRDPDESYVYGKGMRR